MKAVAAAASLLLMLTLPGCSGLEIKAHAPPPATPPPAAPAPVERPALPPAEPAPSAQGETTPVARADASGAAPPCSCPDAKSSGEPNPKPKPKPKRRRKRKPEHGKEAPPQLPTAAAVEDVPPGGTVNAEVKPMDVPVMSILGKRVQGPGGEDLGRVVDVLADASGRVRIAIIDFGGFLGVGNHRIAVDWPLLRFNPDGQDPSLLLSLSPEKLRTAPEYKDNPRPQTLMEPPAAEPAAVKK